MKKWEGVNSWVIKSYTRTHLSACSHKTTILNTLSEPVFNTSDAIKTLLLLTTGWFVAFTKHIIQSCRFLFIVIDINMMLRFIIDQYEQQQLKCKKKLHKYYVKTNKINQCVSRLSTFLLEREKKSKTSSTRTNSNVQASMLGIMNVGERNIAWAPTVS